MDYLLTTSGSRETRSTGFITSKSSGPYSVVERDLNTGFESRQSWLEEEMNLEGCDLRHIRISPNGRWLLWADWHDNGPLVLVDLIKKRTSRITSPVPGPFRFVWDVDSRHWLLFAGLVDPGGLIGNQVDAYFTRVYRFAVSGPWKFDDPLPVAQDSPLNEYDADPWRERGPAGPLRNARALNWKLVIATGLSSPFPIDQEPYVRVVNLAREGLQEHAFPILRPGVLGASDASFSPDGKRVAYVCDRVLHVSNLDGTESTAVFTASTVDSTQIMNPCWVPGDKVLAFGYNQCTCTVTVDR